MAEKVVPERLDPDLAEFVRALARQAARDDHEGKTLALHDPAAPGRMRAVLRVADGRGGHRFFTPDGHRQRSFLKQCLKAIDDLKAGREDELGISKAPD